MSKKVHGSTEKAILRRWQQGEDAVQIANAVGRGSTTVYRVLKRNGITASQAQRRPKVHWARKHTAQQELEIVRRYRDGEVVAEIAREFRCSTVTVKNVVKRHDVPLRPVGGSRREWTQEEIDEIVRRYARGQTQDEIAQAFHTEQGKISRLLRRHGGWDGRRKLRKGGRLSVGGYVHCLVYPDDQFAEMRNSQGYVPEHRLVMALSLGRPLTKGETVHHKNGDKMDNRLENLELRVGPHGRGATEAHCPTCTCFGSLD